MVWSYEIRVRGRLSRALAAEFERVDVAVSELPTETVFNGRFEDQAALYGILRQIEGFGLELIDVHRVVPGTDEQGSGDRDQERGRRRRSPSSGDASP